MSIDDDVLLFLAAEKTAAGALTWKQKGHTDYSESVKVVLCPSIPELVGQMRLTAHKNRLPPKYGFTLLVGSGKMVRVLGLDVNPASSHFNPTTMESIRVTHWQQYPTYDAEPDERELSHRDWFALFLERANIISTVRYKAPPSEDPQMSML